MNKNPLVSIVIATMNTPEITRICLESVRRHTKIPHEIIVICNSRGKAIRKVLGKFSGIQIIRNRRNEGYTHAANQGAALSRGKFICFLNTDTRVPAGWLERLLEPTSQPGVGAVGAEWWGRPPADNEQMHEVLSELADTAMQKWHDTKGRETEKLAGFCLLVPRVVMARVGRFDKRFFFGNEDNDYSIRLRLAGYRLILIESIYVSHIGGASSKSKWRRKHYKLSRKQYLSKWSLYFGKHFRVEEDLLAHMTKVVAARRKLLKNSKAAPFHRPKTRRKVLVSVMMPAHNTERWVAEAIESVLAQDFPSFELIVVDDGSTDRTAQIIRRYLKNPKLRFYQNKIQLGISPTRNHILKLARGKYIAVCDSDDVMRPSFIKLFTDFMEKNSKAGWAYGNRMVIGPSGLPLGRMKAIAMNGRTEYKRNVVNHAGAIIRKKLMLEAGGYDEALTTCEDYDLAFKIARRSQIRTVPGAPQYFYRLHGENTSIRCPFADRTHADLTTREKSAAPSKFPSALLQKV